MCVSFWSSRIGHYFKDNESEWYCHNNFSLCSIPSLALVGHVLDSLWETIRWDLSMEHTAISFRGAVHFRHMVSVQR